MNEISRMTLGTVQLGLDYGIANDEGKPDEEKSFSILDEAVKRGVNCLDTAAGYGDSEEVIGRWLGQCNIERRNIAIATKFKLGDIDEGDVEYDLIGYVERSLVRMGTDYVDYLLMHDAGEYKRYGKQIDSTVSKLMSQGCVKSVGASGYDFKGISEMVENDMYSVFQIPVNILDYRITGTEAEEKLMKKTVFARSIYLQGLFFMDPDKLTGNLKEVSSFIGKMRSISTEHGYSVAGLAMGYVNSLRYVDSLVVGADNPRHVRDNAELIKKPVFTDDFMEMLKNELRGAPDWLFYPWNWDVQEAKR